MSPPKPREELDVVMVGEIVISEPPRDLQQKALNKGRIR